MDKVTVIMPAHNSSKSIAKSIEGVLQQTYHNLELIIICDGSKDNTEKVVKEFSDPRIKVVVLKENQGVSKTRNVGLKLAKGRYISFCDSDDYWYAEKLSIQIELLKKNKVFVCHANCHLADVSGKIIGIRKYPDYVNYKMMRHRNYICNSSGMYDSKNIPITFFKNIYHEDYLMWLEILSPKGISVSSKKPLVIYTLNPDSLSGNKLKSLIGMLRVQRRHGLSLLECAINLFLNIFSRIIPIFLDSIKKIKIKIKNH